MNSKDPINEYTETTLKFNVSGKVSPNQKTVQEIHQATVKLVAEIDKWIEDENNRNSIRNS